MGLWIVMLTCPSGAGLGTLTNITLVGTALYTAVGFALNW
jgi:hypothetical protein